MQKLTRNNPLLLASAIAALAAVAPLGQVNAATSVSVGVDYARGDYGTADTTSTLSVPVSLKHETGL